MLSVLTPRAANYDVCMRAGITALIVFMIMIGLWNILFLETDTSRTW